jgi:putative membrane protein
MQTTISPGAGRRVTGRTVESPVLAPAQTKRTIRQYIGLVLRGFCMGAADVVPGVSGGTMAFVLGIYEELLQSIRTIGQPAFLKLLFGLRLREVLQAVNWQFLLALGAGIFLAIFSLARGIEWLLVNQPVLLWSFFFGLVLASVVAVSQRIPRWTPALWLALAAGAAGAYVIVGLVPVQTPNDWWFLFISGALAICAMILPGISGSFILVLLGKYQYVLSAVNQRDFATLFFVAAGCGVGIVTFAQVLSWLFRRYHDLTVAVLIGLMLGSLRKVWPWKVDIEWILDRHGDKIPTIQHNVVPPFTVDGAFNMEIALGAIVAVAGFALVIGIDRWARRAATI